MLLMNESRAGSTWRDYNLVVQMPHMAPGGKLSEIELLKWLGAFQWESISRALQCPASRIVNADGERLYASFIDLELHFGSRHSLDTLGEDAVLYAANHVGFYAKKFVEGLFVIDDRALATEQLDAVADRRRLAASDLSWACMTNAFIVREGSNTRLKVFKPSVADEIDLPALGEPPQGVSEQARVKAGGDFSRFGDQPSMEMSAGHPLRPTISQSVPYDIVAESDLNGAGLVYFARYPAIMDYGERVFLTTYVQSSWSAELITFLSTEHRRLLYFANAGPADRVEISVTARLLPNDKAAVSPEDRPYHVPLRLMLRTDLHRTSDRTLMASSLVSKTLNVPRCLSSLLSEAEQLLRATR